MSNVPKTLYFYWFHEMDCGRIVQNGKTVLFTVHKTRTCRIEISFENYLPFTCFLWIRYIYQGDDHRSIWITSCRFIIILTSQLPRSTRVQIFSRTLINILRTRNRTDISRRSNKMLTCLVQYMQFSPLSILNCNIL